MSYAQLVEHLFSSVGGEATIVPGLTRAVATVRDDGGIIQLLPAGLAPDDRADRLAASIMRFAVTRLDRAAFLALMVRALQPPPPAPTVARWLEWAEDERSG